MWRRLPLLSTVRRPEASRSSASFDSVLESSGFPLDRRNSKAEDRAAKAALRFLEAVPNVETDTLRQAVEIGLHDPFLRDRGFPFELWASQGSRYVRQALCRRDIQALERDRARGPPGRRRRIERHSRERHEMNDDHADFLRALRRLGAIFTNLEAPSGDNRRGVVSSLPEGTDLRPRGRGRASH